MIRADGAALTEDRKTTKRDLYREWGDEHVWRRRSGSSREWLQSCTCMLSIQLKDQCEIYSGLYDLIHNARACVCVLKKYSVNTGRCLKPHSCSSYCHGADAVQRLALLQHSKKVLGANVWSLYVPPAPTASSHSPETVIQGIGELAALGM